MEQIFREFRVAMRGLRKSLTFAIAAVTTLALGIGANSTIFSVASNVLLRPLPYRDPSRLAIMWNDYGSGGSDDTHPGPGQQRGLSRDSFHGPRIRTLGRIVEGHGFQPCRKAPSST
ncbi:MAG: hypothetical protein LAO09_06055 [Acidobacteriia bacterium]|nr:hypothetical protein [Terriglobia bacterium]